MPSKRPVSLSEDTLYYRAGTDLYLSLSKNTSNRWGQTRNLQLLPGRINKRQKKKKEYIFHRDPKTEHKTKKHKKSKFNIVKIWAETSHLLSTVGASQFYWK